MAKNSREVISEKEATEEPRFLAPRQEVLQKIKGKLSYSEGDQAWSMLRLKKEILQKFPQLKDKSSAKFIYEMHLCSNYEDFKKHIAELEKTKIVPILFHIGIEEK
ncbi:hypothetical protein CO081_00120 [Candidatus Pacearchaeota archaeon CG_4_9_14_0_8_um_filter_35_24]|nr:MAG: hypothetical protein CO081_00120 [Candidatus Pacearchaeota archaeon CG_4_9_14_0_8_um_filter_35_24]